MCGDGQRLRAARVRAAFFADADRWAGLRRFAAARAWRESDSFEAAVCPSRCSARVVASERFRDTFREFG